jgi:threonine dehydrogenase-like Zn-dependent dehydrogenase
VMSDPEEALRQLKKRIQDKAGFAAIDLSGRPETIDLLLEVVPRWGRVMLAGRTRQPLTVDFYNNVHRKGVLLLTSIFDPASVLLHAGSAAYLAAAFRILQNKEMATICAQLVSAKPLP